VRRDRLQRAVVVIFANGWNAEGVKRRLCFKRLQVYHSARDVSLWEDKPSARPVYQARLSGTTQRTGPSAYLERFLGRPGVMGPGRRPGVGNRIVCR
jgi:hypothetical protein